MAQDILHNLPHIDHYFNKVSNEIIMPATVTDIFAWKTNSYQQSIQMFAYIPITIAILYAHICLIIIILLYCCCGRCKFLFSYAKASNGNEIENYHKLSLLYDKQKHPDENIELTKCSRFIRWAFSLLVLISLIFAIVYGTSFNAAIIKIAESWSDSYDDYDTIVGSATQINSEYIPDAQFQCKLILNTSTAEPIYDNITAVNNTLSTSQKYINSFLTSASNVPSWDVINTQITPYREFVIIFPVIALIVFGLLNILNYLCLSHDYLNKQICFCSCSLLVIYLGAFIFIIACIQFAVSVLVADGCNDPDGSIWQAVEVYNNDETTKDVIKYYLYCIDNETITNPLYHEFNSSYYSLTTLNQSIYTLVTTNISQILGIVTESNALYFDYYQSLQLMNEINDTIQCKNIDNYKENMINELCVNGLDFWLVYYLCQIAFILFLVIRSWLIWTKNINSKNNNNNGKQEIMLNNYGGTNNGSMDEGESHLKLHERSNSMLRPKNNKFNIELVESDSELSLNENKNENISINIKYDDNITQYNLNINKTVYDLMEMIENTKDFDTAQQKLMYNGDQLLPDKIIGNTIKNGQIIDLVVLEFEVTLSNEYDPYEPDQDNDLDLPQ